MFFKVKTIFALLASVQLGLTSPIATPEAQDDGNVLVSRAPSTFTHPGVLIDKAQLDFIKGKVAAGAQPWTDAYNSMLGSDLAS